MRICFQLIVSGYSSRMTPSGKYSKRLFRGKIFEGNVSSTYIFSRKNVKPVENKCIVFLSIFIFHFASVSKFASNRTRYSLRIFGPEFKQESLKSLSKLSLDGKPKLPFVLAVNRAHRLWLYGHVHAQRTVQSARNQVRDRKTQSASLTMLYDTTITSAAHSWQL